MKEVNFTSAFFYIYFHAAGTVLNSVLLPVKQIKLLWRVAFIYKGVGKCYLNIHSLCFFSQLPPPVSTESRLFYTVLPYNTDVTTLVFYYNEKPTRPQMFPHCLIPLLFIVYFFCIFLYIWWARVCSALLSFFDFWEMSGFELRELPSRRATNWATQLPDLIITYLMRVTCCSL